MEQPFKQLHSLRKSRKLKQEDGKSIGMFGSNNLSITLLEAGLIDEFRLLLTPVILGEGTPLFTGMTHRAKMTLKEAQQFDSGQMLLTYTP